MALHDIPFYAKEFHKLIGSSSEIALETSHEYAPDLRDSRTKLELSKIGLIVSEKGPKIVIGVINRTKLYSYINSLSSGIPVVDITNSPVAVKKPASVFIGDKHTYHPPKMLKDVAMILNDKANLTIWFVGPTRCGKSTAARYLCEELGFVLHQINCHNGMTPESFIGEKTIKIDEETKQNHIVYCEGVLEKWAMQGLDENGNEIEGAKPGLLFIDEAGALPPQISILLNRMLENDNPRRTFTLEHDHNREVKANAKARIIFAANNCGLGAQDSSQSAYTAQSMAQDLSVIKRIDATFKFGYNKIAEKQILFEKIREESVINKIIKFRDNIRDSIRAGALRTPFSTGDIIKIANLYRIWGDVPKAIYSAVIEQLSPDERQTYLQFIYAVFAVDPSKSFMDDDTDYI